MLNISEFLSVVSWEAVGIAAAVLAVVELLKRTKLLKDGDWARSATLIMSALFAGVDPSDPETAAFAAAVMAIASGAHELIEWAKVKYDEYRKNK